MHSCGDETAYSSFFGASVGAAVTKASVAAGGFDGSSATETPVSSILLMRSIAPMRWVGFKVVAPP